MWEKRSFEADIFPSLQDHALFSWMKSPSSLALPPQRQHLMRDQTRSTNLVLHFLYLPKILKKVFPQPINHTGLHSASTNLLSQLGWMPLWKYVVVRQLYQNSLTKMRYLLVAKCYKFDVLLASIEIHLSFQISNNSNYCHLAAISEAHSLTTRRV